MNRSIEIATLGLLLVLTSCAGSAVRGAGELDAMFARIQVQEARIDHSAAIVADLYASCESMSAAVDWGHAAQSELCRIAHQASDTDALIRCEHAARDVTSQEQTVEAHCAGTGQAR